MTDLLTLLADAAAKERARYRLRMHPDGHWFLNRVNEDGTGTSVEDGHKEACAALLDRLCARAQLRALQEAGYAVVPVEPTGAPVEREMSIQGESPRTIERKCGGWLAVSGASDTLKIGVAAQTEENAVAKFWEHYRRCREILALKEK